MSRKDKILSLALADKENDGPHSMNQTLQKEKTPLQDITTRSRSRSSSSSSSSSSNSSSSTTSSSSTSSSNSPQPNVNTSETQEVQKTERKKREAEYNRHESASSVSVISNSLPTSPAVGTSNQSRTLQVNASTLFARRHRSFSSNFSNAVDFSPDDNDHDYCPLTVTHRTVDESSDIDSEQSENIANSEFEILVETSPTKKLRKGVINSKKLATKTLRNSGKQYTSLSKNNKVMSKRALKPPCGSICRLKCSENINQEEREQIFQSYWEMGSLTRQRDFIASNMTVIQPKYQYKKEGNNRKAKHAFYFTVKGKKIRICKTFFRNTLDINDRPIRTVIEKMTNSGIVEEEKRGKHGRQKRVTDDIIQGIKSHIESKPRIESHYLRQQTSREYIDGGKNLADLYRDYKQKCEDEGLVAAREYTYRRIFNQNYNISFFIPKKDMCELCSIYKNMNASERETIERKYLEHHEEKRLSRLEKENDKKKVDRLYVVACYDLQAVLPLPMCKTSAFYYKSKLNVCNFTICDLARDYCECYVWSEVDGLRGANEIGSCVFLYIKNKAEMLNDDNLQLIFYSDNCCGQQKNQYMFCMYLYALCNYKIQSITHKFLITGHTQNENDNV